MKKRLWMCSATIGTLLASPPAAWADFTFNDVGQFVQDQTPNWLFQILSTILLAVAELFIAMLTGTTAA